MCGVCPAGAGFASRARFAAVSARTTPESPADRLRGLPSGPERARGAGGAICPSPRAR